MPVIPKNLFPSDKIKDLKPGDLITMTVGAVDQDKIDLDYDTISVNPIDSRVPKVKDQEAREMSLDKLEAVLPRSRKVEDDA